MTQTKRLLIRLIRAIIKSNSDSTPVRKRLRGAPREKDNVVRKLQELLYRIRASEGHSWSGRSAQDTTTHELRAQAGNAKLSATLRCDAVLSLAVLGGFIPANELGDGARDQWIRHMVKPEIEPSAQTERLSDVELALKKFERGE